ncbi:hypothetical protein MBLNU459_g7197t1 [Dothideomycetes sp. NU459]
MSTSLEAKLVVLGSQNVGKTSLVHRFVHQTFLPPSTPSTVGASFLTTRVHDPESDTDIRLQIWDTAGQERFRSISKLYYRGAHAAVLCYDITSARSFEDMGVWLRELRDRTSAADGEHIILHIVGTKSDVVAEDPSKREVPFERCIGYVAEQLYPDHIAPMQSSAVNTRPPSTMRSSPPPSSHDARGGTANNNNNNNNSNNLAVAMASPHSNRSSGFWGQEHIWDCCHEISAKDGEGIEEVFRVITRKLIDQYQRRLDHQRAIEATMGRTPGIDGIAAGAPGYFDLPNGGTGSFRVGHGDKRRSWLGFPATPGAVSYADDASEHAEGAKGRRSGRCC